jgi:hypothetical protein
MGILAAVAEAMEGAMAPLRSHRGTTSMQLQSVRFDKSKWTPARAKQWLKKEGLKYGKMDETPSEYRFRQADPDQFSVLRYKTLDAKGGIRAIVAR